MRQLGQMIEKNDAMIIQASMKSEPPKEKLGKKEQARRDAGELSNQENAGSWGGLLDPGSYN